MKKTSVFICVLVLALIATGCAQKQNVSQSTTLNLLRPSKQSEFIGYWRIILFSDDKLNQRIKNKDTGFAGPCQFFINKADGSWLHIGIFYDANEEKTRDHCPLITKEDINLILAANSIYPIYKWSEKRSGMFYMEDMLTGYDNQAWAVDYVTEDVSLPNYFDFNKGDLVMNLGIPAGKGRVMLAWRMVLRPVLDTPQTSTLAVNTHMTAQSYGANYLRVNVLPKFKP